MVRSPEMKTPKQPRTEAQTVTGPTGQSKYVRFQRSKYAPWRLTSTCQTLHSPLPS